MDLTALTKTVRDAIAANALFSDDAANTVFEDYGTLKTKKETALDLDGSPRVAKGKGYDISVWPPARGNSNDQMAGLTGADCAVIVRFEINPKALAALSPSDAGVWVTTRVKAIFDSVLGIPPENNLTRFQLAADCFELVNFDEGLIAYHLRFARFTTFGA
jgi:hypothetical protein